MWEQRTNNTKDQWKIVGSLKRSITKQSKKMEKSRNTRIIWKWDTRGPLVWWFAWEMSPIDSGVWALGPQLLGRFGRCSHAGESTALWGVMTLRIYSLSLLPRHSLCFLFAVKDVTFQLPAPASITDMCHLASLSWWTLAPQEPKVKTNSLLLRLPLTMVLPHSRKITHKIRGYFESLNSNELESLYKRDKYVDTYNPQSWTNEFF